MHKLLFILLPLLSALTVCASARSVQAWQSPESGIVVLTNRQTIQGIVDQQPDKVSVGLASGSLIVLPNARVLFVSQSLGQAYWELAARTRSSDAQGQIDVYRWCVQNHLFDEAANHLLMLQEMDIPAKTLMQLDVNLQITQKRHLEAQQKIATANVVPATVPLPQQGTATAWQDDQTIEIPNLHDTAHSNVDLDRTNTIDEFGNVVDSRFDRSVQQVAWAQSIDESVTPGVPLVTDEKLQRRLLATESLSYTDLDRLTRSMPKGSVGLFRKQVEPLLRQSCSQCHQSEATENAYKIFQGRNGAINRRMSQKNLFQALNLADREQPDASQLILYATTAHGDQTRPSFLWQDAQLNSLKQWLIMVSENPFLPIDEFAPQREAELLPDVKLSPDGDEATGLPTPDVAGDGGPTFAKRLPTALPRSIPKDSASADHSSENVDPFDAKIFNRNFGAR